MGVKREVSPSMHWLGGCLVTLLLILPFILLRRAEYWQDYSYFIFLPAVALAECLFGMATGLFALALAVVLTTFFFMIPAYTFWITPAQLPALALYILTVIGVFAVIEGGKLAAKELRMAWENRHNPVNHVPTAIAPVKRRSGSVDMWRGFILVTIFINHMPGNIFEYITFRNISMSDSAEAFVFLSGVAMVLAYGRKFADGRAWEVTRGLIQRTIRLYGVHVLMSLAAIAIFAAGALAWNEPSLMDRQGRELYVQDPGQFLVAILTLGHQIGYFNILPMYVALNMLVPLFLYLARQRLDLMLGISALLYATSRYYGWNLPNWPQDGGWFFNPLTWQFLLAMGIAAGHLAQRNAIIRSKFLFSVSGCIIFFGAFIVTNGFWLSFGVHDAIYSWLDTNKTNSGLGRLIQFSALVYFIYYTGVSSHLAASRYAKPLILLGRHSLLVFVLLSLFCAVGQVLLFVSEDALWVQIALVAGGLGLMYGACRFVESEGRPAFGLVTWRVQRDIRVQ